MADAEDQLALAEGLLERLTERHQQLMGKKDTVQAVRDASYAKVRTARRNAVRGKQRVADAKSAVERLLLPNEAVQVPVTPSPQDRGELTALRIRIERHQDRIHELERRENLSDPYWRRVLSGHKSELASLERKRQQLSERQ